MYKRSNNLTVRIASPVLELPFKAHNSALIGEEESKRDRLWSINLGNIDFKSFHANIEESKEQKIDEYERFKLSIDSIGFKVYSF